MEKRTLAGAVGAVLGLIGTVAAGAAHADTLDTVKQRGKLICGVSLATPGFAAPDDKGAALDLGRRNIGAHRTNIAVIEQPLGSPMAGGRADVGSLGQISVAARVRFNQVIAVNCGRNGNFGNARGHKLQDRHLRGGILHGNAIGAKLEVGLTGNDLSFGVIQMAVPNLLCWGENK